MTFYSIKGTLIVFILCCRDRKLESKRGVSEPYLDLESRRECVSPTVFGTTDKVSNNVINSLYYSPFRKTLGNWSLRHILITWDLTRDYQVTLSFF